MSPPSNDPAWVDDPLAAANLADPYPYFAHLRETDPVHWNERHRAWFVHRHDDVVFALRNPHIFSSNRIWPIFETKLTPAQQESRRPIYETLGEWLAFLDPPQHGRLRRLVAPTFTPKTIERWRTRVAAVVDDMLDVAAERDRMDLISDFAFPIPAVVIAEMLGVPAKDRDLFKGWSDDIMVLVFGARGMGDRRDRARSGLAAMGAYISDLVTRFRRAPADNLISLLLAARDDEGDLLSDAEIVANCILFLFGGHETTTNLIANGLRCLMEWPDQLCQLRGDPSMMSSAVEEILRYDGPSKTEIRLAASDWELRGKRIAAGDMVYLVQSAANRDPAVFDDPDVLDLRRNPARHVGFGFGIHYCLGAPLARLEGSIALGALIQRFDHFEPDGEVQWVPTMVTRAMSSFPIRYEVVGDRS